MPARHTTMRKDSRLLLTLRPLLGSALLWLATQANALTSDEITSRGWVRIGVLAGQPLYGSTNEKGQMVGYDIDVAQVLAGYLGVKAELIPLPPPARINALLDGKVDFLVATLAPTPERAKLVLFTEPYNAFRMVAVANASLPLAGLDELRGKRVSLNQGSSQESYLLKTNLAGMQLQRYLDDTLAFQAVVANQVDVVVLPETVAREAILRHPDAKLAVKFTLFNQGNAMAVKLPEIELRNWLNKAIDRMRASGELDKISIKWTGSAAPK